MKDRAREWASRSSVEREKEMERNLGTGGEREKKIQSTMEGDKGERERVPLSGELVDKTRAKAERERERVKPIKTQRAIHDL